MSPWPFEAPHRDPLESPPATVRTKQRARFVQRQEPQRERLCCPGFRRNWIFSIKSNPPAFGRSRAYWEAADLLAPRSSAWGDQHGPQGGLGSSYPWVVADEGDPHLLLPDGKVAGFAPQLYTLDGASYESVQVRPNRRSLWPTLVR